MHVAALGGVVGSVAGQALAQAQGSDVDRAGQAAAAQDRQRVGQERAEAAAGIGRTAETDTYERDADGRRDWESPAGARERPPEHQPGAEPDNASAVDGSSAANTGPLAPHGQCGSQLDITA